MLILNFTNGSLPHGKHRYSQFHAFFTLTITEHRTCSICHERYHPATLPQLGITPTPVPTGDILDAAVQRSLLNSSLNGVRASCANACANADLDQDFGIDAAAEYLRVLLNTNRGTGDKLISDVQIPEVLDLTPYMNGLKNPLPVRYRLSSAIYHRGETVHGGHYATGVTSGRAWRPRAKKMKKKRWVLEMACSISAMMTLYGSGVGRRTWRIR